MDTEPEYAGDRAIDDGGWEQPAPSVVVDGHRYAFPGCRCVHIGCEEIADYDGRIEFWDADTETALMVRSPTSQYHELPTMRLAGVAERIAATRGADIEVLGASDLVLRDPAGNRHRILQADQIVYTHPSAMRPTGPAVEIDTGELPDVVLEVDLTTDVRRGKLALYEKWRFPEVWVEVPERRAPSRPGRTPGLAIYLLGNEGYVQAAASSAFPTWTAVEIHTALNEDRTVGRSISSATAAVLRRVGRMMRSETGTGPDDDPFLRAERAEGYAQGVAEGVAEGRVEVLAGIFRLRGLPTSRAFAASVAKLVAPAETLVRIAFACRDEDDFLRRVGVSGD